MFICLFLTSKGETMDGEHMTINTRTGLVSLGSLPNHVRPGDIILICLPPGDGTGCHSLDERGICMVTDTSCHVTKIPYRLPHMASYIVHDTERTFHANAMQPGSHALMHCLMMVQNVNVDLVVKCVGLLTNNTHKDIEDPMGHVLYETSVGSVHFIIEHDSKRNHGGKGLILFFQFLFCFVCVGLFVVHGNLLTRH